MQEKMFKVFIIVSAITIMTLFSITLIYVAESQEAKYDRIFNTPQYNNTVYQVVVNGTVYETTNMRQIVFYYWSDLSENAKRLVNQTMVLNGYTESERSLHFD